MHTLNQIVPSLRVLVLLRLGTLIQRKRTGRWKRPWSFP